MAVLQAEPSPLLSSAYCQGSSCVNVRPRFPSSELRQAAGHLPISPSANSQPNHTSMSEANAEASTNIMSTDNEAPFPLNSLVLQKCSDGKGLCWPNGSIAYMI